MSTEHSRRAPVPPVDCTPTIPGFLHRALDTFGDEPFVITADETLSFREIERRARHFAAQLLADGVGKGTRVAFILPQGPEWVVCFLAVTRIGAVAMPLSTFSTPTEVRKLLRLGDASHLVIPSTLAGQDTLGFAEATIGGLADSTSPHLLLPDVPFVRRVVVLGGSDRAWSTPYDRHAPGRPGDDELLAAVESEVVPADHMVTLFTSGTTSGPKGVQHTHGAQLRHVANIVSLRELRQGQKFFAVMPFFWVAGLTFQLLPTLYFGGALVCQERFDPPTALDLIERFKPQLYLGWPNATAKIRSDPSYSARDLSGVPWLPPLDAPPVDPSRRHGGMGMTETCGNHCIAPASEAARILPDELRGSFGLKVPYVQHKIVDPETGETLPLGVEGEICIRGYSVMIGYAKREREEIFDEDGWFHTGDRGSFRHDCFFFTGRANDMIKTGGSNVAPAEVEAVLAEIAEIKYGLVMGLPDGDRGEMVAVAVVPKHGATIDADAVRAHLRTKLSSYKVPRSSDHIVTFADGEIPWINDAKPDKKVAKELLAQRLGIDLAATV